MYMFKIGINKLVKKIKRKYKLGWVPFIKTCFIKRELKYKNDRALLLDLKYILSLQMYQTELCLIDGVYYLVDTYNCYAVRIFKNKFVFDDIDHNRINVINNQTAKSSPSSCIVRDMFIKYTNMFNEILGGYISTDYSNKKVPINAILSIAIKMYLVDNDCDAYVASDGSDKNTGILCYSTIINTKTVYLKNLNKDVKYDCSIKLNKIPIVKDAIDIILLKMDNADPLYPYLVTMQKGIDIQYYQCKSGWEYHL